MTDPQTEILERVRQAGIALQVGVIQMQDWDEVPPDVLLALSTGLATLAEDLASLAGGTVVYVPAH